jgi:hypothetical protein
MNITTFVPDFNVDINKNTNLVFLNYGRKTVLLQIEGFEMTTSLEKKPYKSLNDNIIDESILWKEIKVIRKPIHLLPFLYNKVRDSIIKQNQVQNNENHREVEDAVS